MVTVSFSRTSFFTIGLLSINSSIFTLLPSRDTCRSNMFPNALIRFKEMVSHVAGNRGVKVNDRNPTGRIPNSPSVIMRQ